MIRKVFNSKVLLPMRSRTYKVYKPSTNFTHNLKYRKFRKSTFVEPYKDLQTAAKEQFYKKSVDHVFNIFKNLNL